MRYFSIDVLRGIAIVLMIQVHFVENLSSQEGDFGWLYNVSMWLGTLPAPLFTFLSGLSYRLWLGKQLAIRRSEKEITRVSLRRGLFLFVVGLLFNVFVWLPADSFNWDILTLIGTSLCILAIARDVPSPALVLGCFMILLLSPPLRVVADFDAYWLDEASFSYDLLLRDVIYGFFANGFFPLLPWLIFPVMGFVVGDSFVRNRNDPAPLGLLIPGVGLMLFAGLISAAQPGMPTILAKHYANGYQMFPATTEYLFLALGGCITSLVLFHWLLDGQKTTEPGSIHRFFRRFSAFSLTIYILHHVLHLWPLWVYGLWKGQADPTFYWRQAMSIPDAMTLAIACILVCYLIAIFLERHPKYSLEALMRSVCEQSSNASSTVDSRGSSG